MSINPFPRFKFPKAFFSAFLLAGLATFQPALAKAVLSAGPMTFADANTLVISDWRGASLHAIQLPPAAAGSPQPFNLRNISTPIAHSLHTTAENLRFEDIEFRPGTGLAYISLSVIRGSATPDPALVSVTPSGKISVISLAKTPHSSAGISNAPSSDKRLWRDVPQATLTVTDLVYYNNKIYVAGLSNSSFSSTLRVYDFPFKDSATSTSIEMYHAVHNQLETRAPIRKMAIIDLDGVPTLLAAYTCTPLVTIPLKDLKDGAHVTGKTIAELGWGSSPVDMVTFDAGNGPMVLLTNSHKSADLMAVSDIAKAAGKPGLSTPIKWPTDPVLGLKSTYIPISGIAHLKVQDKDFLAALRRNEESGAMELMSIRKGYFLRLSDFVNEYDFSDYRYPAGDGWHGVHEQLRTDEGYQDLAKQGQH